MFVFVFSFYVSTLLNEMVRSHQFRKFSGNFVRLLWHPCLQQYKMYPVLSYSLLCDSQSCLTVSCVIIRPFLQYTVFPALSYSLLCDSQSCLTIYSISIAVLQSVV